ncbi:hypothetical protein [Dietzia alimentaria]|uniref:hypothetical protein n=1 Tax=Dietzia alimentaria TaxID=665550 RepID=UPI00030B14C5|nr:hypothetical protein [Dietzia alimentaria]
MVAVVVVLVVVLSAAALVYSGIRQTRIVVGAEPTGLVVSEGLFGANHRYPFDAFGSFTSGGEPQQRLVASAQSTGISTLRYPGGTVANTFRWKRAIGPREDRGCQTGGGDGAPLDSDIGPDEHMALVEQVGAETTMVVNFATATPQEAADWVSYMNAPVGTSPWADLRAEHGHPEPYGVTWWEVGNEPDVGDQAYWMEQDPTILPTEHPERAHKYAYGGTTEFTDQPLTTDCDRRKDAQISDGSPGQVRQVPYAPVAPDPRVMVDGVMWTPVPTLDGAEPDDTVYTLDHESGEVRFGDGTHGAVPPEGSRLTVSYTSGPHAGYVDFVRAMKDADPDIRVCSSYQGGPFLEAIGHDPAFDCQVSHPYTWIVSPMTAAQTHDHVMMGSDWQAAHVAREGAEIRRTAGRDVPLLVSEYGASPVPGFQTWQEPGGDYLASVSPALYVATQLAAFAESGIPVALKHSLVDVPLDHGGDSTSANLGSRNVAIFSPTPDFAPSPTALVLQMLSPLTGHEVLPSTIENGPRRVSAAGQYEALATLATRTGEDLTLTVINRDPERDVEAELVLLDGYRETEVATLDAPRFDSVTDVRVVTDSVSLDADTPRGMFPAHSVTTLTLKKVAP